MSVWILLLLGVAASAGLWVALRQKALPPPRSSAASWRRAMTEAASAGLDAAGSLGVRARGKTSRWSVEAEADLPPADLRLESERVPVQGRLYVGWNVAAFPSGVEHWPEIPVRPPVPAGRFLVRADPDFGVEAWLEEAYVDLLDLETQSGADGLELVMSGGYVRLRLHGARPVAGIVPPLVAAADRLARSLVAAAPEA